MTFAGLLRFPADVIATIGSGFTSDDSSLEVLGDAGILVMRSRAGRGTSALAGDREVRSRPTTPIASSSRT